MNPVNNSLEYMNAALRIYQPILSGLTYINTIY